MCVHIFIYMERLVCACMNCKVVTIEHILHLHMKHVYIRHHYHPSFLLFEDLMHKSKHAITRSHCDTLTHTHTQPHACRRTRLHTHTRVRVVCFCTY